LSNEFPLVQKLAVIAGTGFESAFTSAGEQRSIRTPYGDVRYFLCDIAGNEVVVLARHETGHSVPPHRVNNHAQLWALKEVGVDNILATAATGSLRIDRHPGDIIVLSDFIDMRGVVTTFYDGENGVIHTDFSEPFSEQLRQALIAAGVELGKTESVSSKVYDKGTYLCVSGPRYETPAEVRFFGRLGADVVGMTIAQEAILAREIGISYAAIAVVTNYGTGLSGEQLSHEDVNNQMERKRSFVAKLLERAVIKLFKRNDS